MLTLLYANEARARRCWAFRLGLGVSVGYCAFLVFINVIEKATRLGRSIVPLDWYVLSPFSAVLFFCPLFCYVFLSAEYEDGWLRSKLTIGHTRKSVYLSGYLAVYGASAAVLLAATATVAVLHIPLLGGWVARPARVASSYAAGLLTLGAYAACCSLPAQLIAGRAASALACLLPALLAFVAQSYVQSHRSAMGPLWAFWSDLSPMGQLIQLTRDGLDHPGRAACLSLLVTAAALLAGMLAFQKKNLR